MKLKKWKVQAALAAGCLLAGLFSGAALADDVSVTEMEVKEYELNVRKANQEAVFPRGVSVEGKSLEGMTLEETEAWINDYVEVRQDRPVTLTVFWDNEYDYKSADFGVSWKNQEILDTLTYYISDGNFVEQYKKQKDLDNSPISLEIEMTVDESNVREKVESLADSFYMKSVDATVSMGGSGFIVTPEIWGREFDSAAITSELTQMLSDFDNTEAIVYDLPYIEVEPTYTTADFAFSPSPLGSCSTGNLGPNPNREWNIQLSASRVNGTVVYPGQEISALALYGPQTEENGYLVAPGYENGQQVPAVGGGVCQTTTTFYNALLQAELQITQRSAHSMLVTYIAPGLDAAVAEGSKDLKFVNNLNHPVYLEAYVANGLVTINVWGVEERPANRRIEYTYNVEQCIFPDPLYNIVVDDSICAYGPDAPMGKKLSAEVETHPDVWATSYKNVYIDGNLVEHTQLNHDHYDPMVGLLYMASDCKVVNEARTSSSPTAVYRYLGWDIYHGIFFRDGTGWDPNNAEGHY